MAGRLGPETPGAGAPAGSRSLRRCLLIEVITTAAPVAANGARSTRSRRAEGAATVIGWSDSLALRWAY